MKKFEEQVMVEQIKRGRGRPRKYPRASEFATVNLGHGDSLPVAAVSSQVSCEWTRSTDGARMRMLVPAIDAANLIEAFLGGGQ